MYSPSFYITDDLALNYLQRKGYKIISFKKILDTYFYPDEKYSVDGYVEKFHMSTSLLYVKFGYKTKQDLENLLVALRGSISFMELERDNAWKRKYKAGYWILYYSTSQDGRAMYTDGEAFRYTVKEILRTHVNALLSKKGLINKNIKI